MTWLDLALVYPEFVGWVAQRYGGVPDGAVTEEDYNRFKTEYNEVINNG